MRGNRSGGITRAFNNVTGMSNFSSAVFGNGNQCIVNGRVVNLPPGRRSVSITGNRVIVDGVDITDMDATDKGPLESFELDLDAYNDIGTNYSMSGLTHATIKQGDKLTANLKVDAYGPREQTNKKITLDKKGAHVRLEPAYVKKAELVISFPPSMRNITCQSRLITMAQCLFPDLRLSFEGALELVECVLKALEADSLTHEHVDCTRLTSQVVSVNSMSGNLEFDDCRVESAFTLKTMSGNVRLQGGSPAGLVASTMSGDIDVRSFYGRNAKFNTMSGDVHVDQDGEIGCLSVNTMSGSLSGSGSVTPSFSTMSGRNRFRVTRSVKRAKVEDEKEESQKRE